MPLVVPELEIVARSLVAAELAADRVVDQLGQIMGDGDVRAQAEEDVAERAGRVLLAPNPAVAERGDRADALVERDALAPPGLELEPLASRACCR